MSKATWRGVLGPVAVAGTILMMFAIVPAAQAGTLYACIKNGTAHLYTKKPKCKKGETKLSWASTGPAGKTGATGAPGAVGKEGPPGREGPAGKNGAVAGFSASTAALTELPEPFEFELGAFADEERLILSKTLPAGSYLISGKAQTFALGKSVKEEATYCELWNAGTEKTIDSSFWSGPLAEYESGKFEAGTALPLQAALTTTSSVSIQIWCSNTVEDATGGEDFADGAQLFAVQTSQNS